jgi:hypothetical protein
MKKLPENWLTAGLQDAEYKRYLFLGFLQAAERERNALRFYPLLPELHKQENYLKKIKENTQSLESQFKGKVTGIDWERLTLNREKPKASAPLNLSLELLDFALPRLRKIRNETQTSLKSFSQALHLEPIGIQPLYRREGYLLLPTPLADSVDAYRFRVETLQTYRETWRNVKLWFVLRVTKGMFESYLSLKKQLIEQFRDLPQPLTFWAETGQPLPLEATLLPLLKQRLVQEVKKA